MYVCIDMYECDYGFWSHLVLWGGGGGNMNLTCMQRLVPKMHCLLFILWVFSMLGNNKPEYNGIQITPMSSSCSQSCWWSLVQSSMELSFPLHFTLSNQIGPDPDPNVCGLLVIINAPIHYNIIRTFINKIPVMQY